MITKFEMKFEESAVLHYLYGYQPMRLATFEEVNRTLETSVTPKQYNDEINSEMFEANEDDEESTMKPANPLKKIRLTDGIALCVSSIPGAKYGACAIQNIAAGTWFGPFEGKLVRTNENYQGQLSEFMWEIFHEGEVSHFLDGRNQYSWMSFVKCARHKKEQNMVVFQYHGCIYYRTIQEIKACSELLVWYDSKYTQLLGMPLTWNDTKSSNGKRKIVGRRTGESLQKKKHQRQKTRELSSSKRSIDMVASLNSIDSLEDKEFNGVHLDTPNLLSRRYCSPETKDGRFSEKAYENHEMNHLDNQYNQNGHKTCHGCFQNSALLENKCMQAHLMRRNPFTDARWSPLHTPNYSNCEGLSTSFQVHTDFTNETKHSWLHGCPQNYHTPIRTAPDVRCTIPVKHRQYGELDKRKLQFP